MRILTAIAGTIFLSFAASGQVFERIESPLAKNVPDCYTIGYNLLKLIPKYHRAAQWDSLRYVIEYYNERCQLSEHFKHFEVLNAISTGNFRAEKYPEILDLLHRYHYNTEVQISAWDQPAGVRQAWLRAHKDYYDFLKEWALNELKDPPADFLQRDILKAYAGEEKALLVQLKKGEYQDSVLQEKFNEELKSAINADEFFFEIITGTWFPQSNLSRLGVHPVLGLSAGGFNNKMRYSAGANFRFLKSPEEYRIRRNDSIFTDDYFFSLNLAFDAYRSLFRNLRHDLSVGAGIGYDGITFHVYDTDVEYEAESISSPNFNVGLGYSFYYNYQHYLRLEARYQFLNYRNNINNDLSGNAFEIRLIIGFTDNYTKKRLASRLK